MASRRQDSVVPQQLFQPFFLHVCLYLTLLPLILLMMLLVLMLPLLAWTARIKMVPARRANPPASPPSMGPKRRLPKAAAAKPQAAGPAALVDVPRDGGTQ